MFDTSNFKCFFIFDKVFKNTSKNWNKNIILLLKKFFKLGILEYFLTNVCVLENTSVKYLKIFKKKKPPLQYPLENRKKEIKKLPVPPTRVLNPAS